MNKASKLADLVSMAINREGFEGVISVTTDWDGETRVHLTEGAFDEISHGMLVELEDKPKHGHTRAKVVTPDGNQFFCLKDAEFVRVVS